MPLFAWGAFALFSFYSLGCGVGGTMNSEAFGEIEMDLYQDSRIYAPHGTDEVEEDNNICTYSEIILQDMKVDYKKKTGWALFEAKGALKVVISDGEEMS